MLTNNKDNGRGNLGYLGIDFQYRLIHSFFVKEDFFNDLNSIIDQNMFTDTYLRGIVTIIKEYYSKYKVVPSYDMISIKVNEKTLNEDDKQYYQETLNKIKSMPNDGLDEIEDMAERFFKQQNWIKVSNEIKRVAGDGDLSKYDDLMEIVNKAYSIGRRSINYFNPYDNLEDNLTPSSTTFIPTGIDRIDETIGGGLEKGKIGVVIAPSGVGKTSFTTGISAYAASYRCAANNNEGFKILQIVFEDTKRDLSRKYYGRITQVESADLDKHISEVRDILNNYADKDAIINNIRCIRMVSGETKAKDIRDVIEKMMQTGWVPDEVIVDYFECVEVEGKSGENEWKREAKTMRKFETMAQELNIAMWIPIQGGKDSISAEMITMDKASGAVQKIQIPQVVMSIARPYDGSGNNNHAVFAILKHRGGRLGGTINVNFNNGTCTIKADNSIDFDSALAYNDFVAQKEEEKKQNMKNEARKLYTTKK